MLVRTIYFLVVLVLCLVSCQKSIDKTDSHPYPAQTLVADSAASVFDTCHCSAGSIEFIRGIFHNVPMCFATPVAFSDSFGNAYYYEPGVQDQMNLIRQNESSTVMCEFFLMNTDVYHKSLPYIIPYSNPAYGEYVNITLLDLSQPWASQCQGCVLDDADYFGDTWNGLSFTVTDTTGGYIKGTFQGKAATPTGKTIHVSDGSFDIHIHQMPIDTNG